MAYKRNELLNDYDIYPLVVKKDVPTTIHILPRGGRPQFEIGREYDVLITATEEGDAPDFPLTGNHTKLKAVCNEKGGFDIEHTFDAEEEFFIMFFDENAKSIQTFSVYCIEKDLQGRYPFIGDLHMHTLRSDGRQKPATVAANYRKYGYDFTVISDHGRYYPSLEAIEAYKDVDIEMTIVPGEEVHLPRLSNGRNDIHIVNFGGEYSINALVDTNVALEEKGTDKKYRSLNGECPDIMPFDEFEKKMQGLAEALDVPDNIERIPYAMSCWEFDEIRKANGLAIFAHPCWKKAKGYQVPDVLCDYMLEHHDFDAFEVLGGERYFEHNGFQTIKYYEQLGRGNRLPIVGSTDSHSSYESNDGAFICETIVFSAENEKNELIESIKDFYSVAVDTISKEYRLVGENRLVRYARFLLDNYFPIHDEYCYEEGRLMRQYVDGTEEEKEDAKKTLSAIYGRVAKMRKKYFEF